MHALTWHQSHILPAHNKHPLILVIKIENPTHIILYKSFSSSICSVQASLIPRWHDEPPNHSHPSYCAIYQSTMCAILCSHISRLRASVSQPSTRNPATQSELSLIWAMIGSHQGMAGGLCVFGTVKRENVCGNVGDTLVI